MVNAWSLAWEELNGTMNETYPINTGVGNTAAVNEEIHTVRLDADLDAIAKSGGFEWTPGSPWPPTVPIPDPDGGVNTVDGYKFSLESDIDLNTGGYKVPADILQFPTTIPGADIKIDSTSDNITFTGGDYSACNNASWDYNLSGVSVGDIDLSGNLDFTTNDIHYTDNVVSLGDTRVGKDLDKLDDVIDKDKHAQDLNDRDGE